MKFNRKYVGPIRQTEQDGVCVLVFEGDGCPWLYDSAGGLPSPVSQSPCAHFTPKPCLRCWTDMLLTYNIFEKK